MKRYWILLLLLFVPFVVKAETCDADAFEIFSENDLRIYSFDGVGYNRTDELLDKYTVVKAKEVNDYFQLCDRENAYVNNWYTFVIDYEGYEAPADKSHNNDPEGWQVSYATKYIMIADNHTYLYQYPFETSKKLMNEPIPGSTELTILQKINDYVAVEYNGQKGWIKYKADELHLSVGENFTGENYLVYAYETKEKVEVCTKGIDEQCEEKVFKPGERFNIKYKYDISTLRNQKVYFCFEIDGKLYWVNYDEEKFEATKDLDYAKEIEEYYNHHKTLKMDEDVWKYIKFGALIVFIIVISIILIIVKKKKPVVEQQTGPVVNPQPFINNNVQQPVQQPVQQTNGLSFEDLMKPDNTEPQNKDVQ